MEKYFEYANPNESDDEIMHYLLEFFRNEGEYTKNELLTIVRRGEPYYNKIKSVMKINYRLSQLFLLKIKPDYRSCSFEEPITDIEPIYRYHEGKTLLELYYESDLKPLEAENLEKII